MVCKVESICWHYSFIVKWKVPELMAYLWVIGSTIAWGFSIETARIQKVENDGSEWNYWFLFKWTPHSLDQKEHFWLVILKSPQMHIDIQKCAVGGDYTGVEVKRRK